jgi:hypothetical protein
VLHGLALVNLNAVELYAVRKVVPFGCFAADEKWQTANTEVREIVGKKYAVSASELTSRAARAALMPASLPPMIRIRMAGGIYVRTVWESSAACGTTTSPAESEIAGHIHRKSNVAAAAQKT